MSLVPVTSPAHLFSASSGTNRENVPLRGEVDLAQLSEQLVAVVEETMRPTHVSLWLNKPQSSRSAFNKDKDSASTAIP